MRGPVRLILIVVLAALAGGPVSAELTIDAPEALAAAAARIRAVDHDELRRRLERAGLMMPDMLRVTLVPNGDPRAADVPPWIVGLAFGTQELVIFPGRVPPYPYDSIESVFRHEVAHLALTRRAGGRPLPRWFHEGVAMSVDRGWGTSGRLRLLFEMVRSPGTARLGRLFASGTQPDSAAAYALSAALVADVQQRHGADVVGAIAGRVAEGAPFDRAFALETGEAPDAAAARAWAVYLRWTNWVPALTSGNAIWSLILVLAAAAWFIRRRRRARRWPEDEADI